MKFVIRIAVATMLAASSLVPQAAAQILINEVMADPASDWDGDGTLDARGDEYVEIVNVGSMPVDLSAWAIGDAAVAPSWRVVLSGTLMPGEIRVVFGSDAMAAQAAAGTGAVGLSLNNAGDTVTLYRLGPADTVAVDARGWGGAEVRDDRALGRSPDGGPDWVVFDALNPYSGSALPASGCAPSPGAGVTCALPVETSTWGRVKAQYR